MNCKPGLAMIISGFPVDKPLIGKIVFLTSISRTFPNVCWFYKGEQLMTILGPVIGLADNCMRPIRPGESPEESIEAMRLLHQIEEKA